MGNQGWARKDPRYSGSQWRNTRAAVIRASNMNCGICGHPVPVKGASIDHIEPVEIYRGSFYDMGNLQVVHGRLSPCSICSAASGRQIKGDCQSLKGSTTMAQAQARLFRRTGLAFGQVRAGATRPAQPHSGPETAPVGNQASSPEGWPYSDVRQAYRDLCGSDLSLARDDARAILDNAHRMSCRCGPPDGTDPLSEFSDCRCYDRAWRWAGEDYLPAL